MFLHVTRSAAHRQNHTHLSLLAVTWEYLACQSSLLRHSVVMCGGIIISFHVDKVCIYSREGTRVTLNAKFCVVLAVMTFDTHCNTHL